MLFYRQFLADFRKISKKGKILVYAILAFSFIVGIIASIISFNLFKNPPSTAILKLTADKTSVSKGDTFTATLNIDSQDWGVEAADLVLNFDPQYLKVTAVSPGNFFKVYPLKKIEESRVKLSGVANFVNNTFIIPKGTGTITSLTFQTLASTSKTTISIDKQATIVASAGKNILGNTTNLAVSIK